MLQQVQHRSLTMCHHHAGKASSFKVPNDLIILLIVLLDVEYLAAGLLTKKA